MLMSAVLGLFFGTFVDHHKKKHAMRLASVISLLGFSAAAAIYVLTPHEILLSIGQPMFWLFAVFILAGAVAGNMRNIALSTTVTLLVDEDKRDKANGLVGSASGLAFAITSVFSGLAIGFLGMGWALAIAIAVTMGILLHLSTITVDEPEPTYGSEEPKKKIDVKGALQAIRTVPGLMPLIFFTTFNNFLGGVFMSLLDPYGLNLMSVESWGTVWGFVCIGFIFGGLVVAKKGLGKNPVFTMFAANVAMWVVCILFPLKSIIPFLVLGLFAYMTLIPVVEAAEQTIIQKVVPQKKQGRVFGFAQSVEMAASPITAFLIGPIAHIWIIPYMTTGSGVDSIGKWFGAGELRAFALIFIVAGLIGLTVTLLAMASRSYRLLSHSYRGEKSVQTTPEALANITPRD